MKLLAVAHHRWLPCAVDGKQINWQEIPDCFGKD